MVVGDILDRLPLRIDGQLTNAAQILFGKKFMPRYPQALLKLGRFRGTKITGDIVDNKQEYMNAFAMVREAIEWLDRTLPLAARFPPGAINREDRLPVPADALREIIINAVIHRDVSNASSYVAIAVFDDRIEVRSIGDFPTGVRAELLSREHLSVRRNPLIADAFHRTGAIEAWGRGTNRVIEVCRAYGIPDPTFLDADGAVIVTFKADVVADAGTKTPPAGSPDATLTQRQQAILQVLLRKPSMALREIAATLEDAPSDRRLREELLHLKKRGLVEQSGHGRGSAWSRRRGGE
jgi:ATP-dependent DNA helicase RecG